MREKEIAPENLMFTNSHGETLDLLTIVKSKKINSVTLEYLSKGRYIRDDSWIGKLLGFKKETLNRKKVTVTDSDILFHLPEGIEPATAIHFSSKDEFRKIREGSYDINTMWKQNFEVGKNRFSFSFCIKNLKQINWV